MECADDMHLSGEGRDQSILLLFSSIFVFPTYHDVLIVLLECIIQFLKHYSLIVLLEYIDLLQFFESINKINNWGGATGYLAF